MKHVKSSWQRWTLFVAALMLALTTMLLPRPVAAAMRVAPMRQGYTYAECSQADAAAVQGEMTTIAQGLLTQASSGLDVNALVARQWQETNIGVTLDQAVDAAIVRLQAREGYWSRFWSGWSADKAEEFAAQAATEAFNDPALTAKLDELAAAIAASLVIEMETATAQSASSALLCLQDYVGEQYSATLFTAFQAEVSQELGAELALEDAVQVQVAPLDDHTKGLTGIGVIVASQITRRIAASLAQKITGRLAGKIAGRVLGRLGSSVIPYIGWAVGAGLIIWDLVEGSQGALPQIREALQSEEVKQEVRVEIAAAVREGVTAEVQAISTNMATTLVGQWQGYCTVNADLCTLARTNADFQALLDMTPVGELDALAAQVNFFLMTLGPERMLATLADGSFLALLVLPPEATEILTWTRSPQTTLAWAEVAGTQLPEVVEYQLYRTIDPHAITSLSLAALVTIGDNDSIHKLSSLASEQLALLLTLPTAELQTITAAATGEELAWLADHLASLAPIAAAQLSADLAAGDMTLAMLRNPSVAESVPAVGGAVVVPPALEPVAPTPMPLVTPLMLAVTNNGVLIAALLVVLALLAIAVLMYFRNESPRHSG